jgi:hypothetical protein
VSEPDVPTSSAPSRSDAGVSREWAQSSHEVEDARWSVHAQLGDWFVLLVMMLVVIGVHVFVFLTEPGIRDFGS